MRKFAAPALIGLGSFLLVAGILALVWVPDTVKKTPLDVDTITRLAGEAARIDPETGSLDPRPIYAQSVTRVDSEASTDDEAVFAQWSCAAFGTEGDCLDLEDPNLVLVPEDELITASEITFATDRVTAEGVDPSALPDDTLPDDAAPVEGLVNKFPFDTEKRTYRYWENTLGRAVDAVYDRTEDVEGVEAYVFVVEVTEEPVEIAEDTPGTYSSTKEIFVEPATGAILDQTDDQQRWLEDGTQVLDLQVGFTDDQVASFVDDAKSNKLRLTLMTTVLPVVGLAGGLLLILAGLLLALRGRRNDQRVQPEAHDRPLVNA